MLSLPARTAARAVLFLPLLAAPACEGGPTGLDEGLLTVTGTVTNRTAQPVPADARVVVAWEVSSGSPDYTYVFGEGTVRGDGKTFRLVFDAPPPPEALHSNGLGVGLILLTTDATIGEGTRLEASHVQSIVGAAGQYAVIYVAGGPAAVGNWAAAFPKGYSVGKGVKRTGTFDAFQPANRTSVEIIVDALENIDFVNWT